jgi:hypothetical protein
LETNQRSGVFYYIIPSLSGGIEGGNSIPMPRDITMKPFRIVTAVCAFSLSMAQVKAEDTLNRAGRWGVGSVQLAVFGEEDVRAGKPVTDE